MSAEQSRPLSRLRGLVPEVPLPDPEPDPNLTEEERRVQKLQVNLLGRYGPPGAAQQQVSQGDATSDRVMPNQVRAGLEKRSVPITSRQATEGEVRQLFARPKKNVIIFGREDDEDRYPRGSVERELLDAAEKMNRQRKKRGA